ncbi:hypothetical protein [Corallincola spongiicola]|uniref:Uncharacterized protein n=1 Tax=Corallincola spongiicola TaxID=2520508 RepID=A0ABY1WR42_9GAMM|nr:hypothetical protein [Corallincola spongiicola]TAA47197.1 hypothetical protein EXY25_08125 [Corallincola spongiicola]
MGCSNALKVVSVLGVVHLLLYLFLIAQSMLAGEPLSTTWAVHIGVAFAVVVWTGYRVAMTFYVRLVYLLAIPSYSLYRFSEVAAVYQVTSFDWVYQILTYVSLYLAIPFLILGRSYYLNETRIPSDVNP